MFNLLLRKSILLLGMIFYTFTLQAQNYSVPDNRAKNAPLSQAESKEQIVSYLTKGLQSDESKARALAAFIAYQFQRNGYEQKKLKEASSNQRLAPSSIQNDFFKTRIGSSFDFARLYQELGALAGLHVVTIKGYAGKSVRTNQTNNTKLHVIESGLKQLIGTPDYKLQQYQAAWNAVKINGKWQLVDTYWMIKGNQSIAKEIDSKRSMERFLAQREQRPLSVSELTQSKQIDNAYFDAKPRFFIKTHFPLDNKWQLLPVPVTFGNFITN